MAAAGLFVPAPVVDEALSGLALSGFAFNGFAFKGFAFRGFMFAPPNDTGTVGVAAAGFEAKERTTFSAPSSRLRPSSIGGVVLDDGEGSVATFSMAARSICSAMSRRSRCSSEVVARSFFIEASYKSH